MAAIAPPTDRSTSRSSALAEPRAWSFTLEQALYCLIGVLAIISHLYLLDVRAFHHDETLHADYSWRIYQGQGYTHDPLLHGPFLYYITAFVFLLFSDTDWTARLSVALFGICLVLLPWLMRREFGRGAALLASGYLLISPIVLYVGRFLRHDIYAVTFELLAVVAILRYVATEQAKWHYIFAAALGLMLVTMETFYLFLVIMGSFVVIWMLWQVARQLIWLLAAYGIGAGLILTLFPRWFGPLPLPSETQALQVRHQPDNDLIAYAAKVSEVLPPLLLHPASLTLLLGTLAFAVVMIFLVFVRRDANGRSAWRRAANNAPAGTVVGALDRIPARQWLIAFGIVFAIYAVFYTALLSNPTTPNTAGLVTGITGSFLYWLGQHSVQRGGQPLHYYLFQLSVYEPLLLVFGTAGLGLLLTRLFQAGKWNVSGPEDDTNRSHAVRRRIDMTLFAPALIVWWSVGALLIYSWAGEKMPWLTLHIVVPLALLSAWAVAQLWRWATRMPVDRLMLLLTSLVGILLILMFNRLIIVVRTPELVHLASAWAALAFSFVALLAAALAVLHRSGRPAIWSLLVLLLVFGLPFTLRNSLRLSFINGDVPVEPMVYVQTSPDVPRVMQELRRASLLHTGKLDLPIRYDNETIWSWYLRNYNRTEGSGNSQLGPISEDVQVVFLLAENVQANEGELDGFIRQRYPLRWWFPEQEVYRFPQADIQCGTDTSPLLPCLLRQPWDGQAFAAYWRFWFDRELPAPLGSTDWMLFVRPELASEFGIGGREAP
jgi:uncharacterized protein (TIGR03663 family)